MGVSEGEAQHVLWTPRVLHSFRMISASSSGICFGYRAPWASPDIASSVSLLGCCNKTPQTGDSNHRCLFLLSPGGWKSTVTMSAGLVPSEAFSLARRWLSLPFVLIWLTICIPIFSVYNNTHHIGLGPTHGTPFYLNHLFRDPASKCSHILRAWGLGLQCRNFWGRQSSP